MFKRKREYFHPVYKVERFTVNNVIVKQLYTIIMSHKRTKI